MSDTLESTVNKAFADSIPPGLKAAIDELLAASHSKAVILARISRIAPATSYTYQTAAAYLEIK